MGKGGTVEMNPGISTYSAVFRTQNTVLEFGADIPLGPLTIGASATFGSVESEVFLASSTGDILTNTIATGLSAIWKYQGFYADAQGRYVNFSNDMEADGEVVDCDLNPDYKACSLYTENGEIDELNEFADNEESNDGKGSSSSEDDRAAASKAAE